MAWGLIALSVTLLLGACGDASTPGLGSGKSPKQVCQDANQAQRDATKLENELRTGTDADAETYLKDAQALDGNLSSLLANGGAAGSSTVNNDIAAALTPIKRIESDLLKPDLPQANVDAETLRNAMIQLGMDCSSFLGG
jgi:hypothetical protein